MRYLVKARVKEGREKALLLAMEDGSLGKGSIAGDEYVYDLENARVSEDGTAHWVETCFCATPLQEERPYWEQYFDLVSVKDAHNRKNCRDLNGTELWACSNCDCTKRLEEHLHKRGKPFLERLREGVAPGADFGVVFPASCAFSIPMRRCLVLLVCFSCVFAGEAATGRVIKVLPHFLDLQGRHTLSPSLFDRDAYQAVLREHPEQRSAIRFDIEWKSKDAPVEPLRIQAEIRGVAAEKAPVQLTLEKKLEPTGWFGRWTSLTVKGEDYRKLGELTAWRVTLWEGNRLLSEQKSFLW